MSSSFLLCVLGDGGGVMSKVGMCCDCSRHYTEQGSKSCRKQDLLKKMACLWVLINSVPVFQGEQRKQKSQVGRSAKTLFIMTSYQWKNSQSALLFVSTSFFFWHTKSPTLEQLAFFSGFMKRLFYHVMNTFIHICKYCWRHWQFGEKNYLTGLGKYCSQTLKSKKIKSNKSIFCIS